MEGKFTQYIEAKFPSDGKRGTIASGVIHAAYAHKIKQCIFKIPTIFQKNFVTL